jgi:hypothetical protein
LLYGRHHELIVITEPEVSPEIVVWSSLPEVSPHYVPINKLSLTQLYYTMQTLVKKNELTTSVMHRAGEVF